MGEQCKCLPDEDDALMCKEAYPRGSFRCTLAKGHTGDHMACGLGDLHNIETWPQEVKA